MESTENLALRKFVAPEFIYGQGALNLAGQYSENFGAKKAMIVTDPGVRRAGWSERVEKDLKRAGISFVIFDGVTPNPKDDETMTGAELFAGEKCDLIIAIGGGSPMDCAKGIGIVTSNQRHVLEFEGVDEVDIPGPPLICIPTTAGSSADVSQFAIITDTGRKTKIAIISKTVVPDVALIDPETTTTMPAALTAATGMDALVHSFEAYVSNAGSPITDMFALEAIRLIPPGLPRAIKNPDDVAVRSDLMLASLNAGLAFSNASLGLVHGMAHSLGGFLDLAHGDCNALLLEHVVEYNYDANQTKYGRIAEAMGISPQKHPGESLKSALLQAISELRQGVGITMTLSDIGVKASDIPQLAEYAFVDPCLATNPRQPTVRDIEMIYEKAL